MGLLNLFKKHTDAFGDKLKDKKYTYHEITDIILAYYFYNYETELDSAVKAEDFFRSYNKIITDYGIKENKRDKINALINDVSSKYGFDENVVGINYTNKYIEKFGFSIEPTSVLPVPDQILAGVMSINLPANDSDDIAEPYKDKMEFRHIDVIHDIADLRYLKGNFDLAEFFKARNEFYKSHTVKDQFICDITFIFDDSTFHIADCDIYDINVDYGIPYDCISIDYNTFEITSIN